MSAVRYNVADGVAVITLDNPPVNALSAALRTGILDALMKAKSDASAQAVVLIGSGRTFSGGADITEFGKPYQGPSLVEIEAALEDLGKPTVAALHGTVMGGGLEIPLGAHYRVAAPTARLGLPEIKLGLLPGAGGTQRLPRLIGVEKALQIIVSGDPVPASQAKADGLVDEIVEGDLEKGAVAYARRLVAEKKPLRRARDLPAHGSIEGAQIKKGRSKAVAACVEAVKNATTMPFDEAMKRERQLFQELVQSDESRAQRYIFFAEREALKIPGMPESVKGKDVQRAAVIGAGTMGGGIAMSFANAGVPVTLVEQGAEQLQRGLATIESNYKRSSRTAPEEIERRIKLVQGVTDMGAAKDADIVIEAVFEEMSLKKEVFGKLDKVTRPDTVLATNTSYLNVNEIAAQTARPPQVLGMHFFSPANIMRLLEIVRAEKTSHEALATAIAVGKKLGKVPVVVGVCHGFVGNRMLSKRGVETERLLLEGALPQEIDAAVVEFGFPMGPCAMGDMAGLDVGMRIRRQMGTRAEVSDSICELGRYGQKTGAGYYRYEKGSRTPLPDPEVEKIIVEASKRKGITRRKISPEEIIERQIYPMINEGARILEEGIAYRPSDIDVIWVYGYGWPAYRGGPMWYADHVGLAKIAERLEHYAKITGDESLKPAKLLRERADSGKGFAAK